MTYTFISAKYANEEHTAAEAMTQEAAMVLLSAGDTPTEWDELHNSEIEISAYVPPEPALPPQEVLLSSPNGGVFKFTVNDEGQLFGEVVE